MIGPLSYIGGKRRLAPQLVALIPDHTTYIEPFAGGSQVLFHKSPSRVEVLNDLDEDLINFFRVIQMHGDELVRWLRHAVVSRRLHQLYAQQDTRTLTDIQRAARFLYLQKNSFGGLVRRQTYHYCVVKPSNFDPRRIPELIRLAADRLARVQLESLPYEDVLTKYDRPTSFFYCDPPYIGRSLYRFNLTDEDFAGLAERLAALRGKFILSINDCPLSRALFRSFPCREIALAYTASRRVPTVTELVFSNFQLPSMVVPRQPSRTSNGAAA